MVDPFAPRGTRNRNPFAPREDREPDYSPLPGFDGGKGDFYGAGSVPTGRNFWGSSLGDVLEDDLNQQSALQAETEAERMRTNSYVNAYRLAAERRGGQQLADAPKPPGLGAELGKTALNAGIGAAVTAGFALI